jgi:hypothetical protein
MERRKAVTAAAAASLTMLAGAAGIALNSGIVGATNHGSVGQLTPVSTATAPITVYVDEPAAPATSSTSAVVAAPVVTPAVSTPVATSAASGYEDDDRSEDDDDDHDGYEDYEGADDDD